MNRGMTARCLFASDILNTMALAAIWACAGPEVATRQAPELMDVQEVADSSRQFMSRIGESIGFIEEGRYFAGRVVIMDRFDPHLRLFTLGGKLLWTGGRRGGGPAEFERPHAIAAGRDSTLLVFQRARVSSWRLAGDSLAFSGVFTIPARYLPLGGVSACDEGWLFYARDDAMFDTTTWQVRAGPEVGYLHTLRFQSGAPVLRTLWSEPRDPNTIAVSGHSAVLIGRTGRNIAVLHRAGAWSAGRILQFDCEGRVVGSQSEMPLITGDSVLAIFPRRGPLQWTSGIVALENGWMMALHRHLDPAKYAVEEWGVKTEIFDYAHGKVRGSAVVDGQWQLLDYDADYGILMGTSQPSPHFVRVPVSALEPTANVTR